LTCKSLLLTCNHGSVLGKKEIFRIFRSSILAVKPNYPPTLGAQEALSVWVKRPGHASYHLPQNYVETMSGRLYTDFITWALTTLPLPLLLLFHAEKVAAPLQRLQLSCLASSFQKIDWTSSNYLYVYYLMPNEPNHYAVGIHSADRKSNAFEIRALSITKRNW